MGALVESEALTSGATGVGSRFRDVFEDHGQRLELEAEVRRYEPPGLLEVALRSSGFDAVTRQTLDERAGRTRVTAEIETEYTKRVARLLAGVVTRHAQRRLEADLETLRRLVEEGGGSAR